MTEEKARSNLNEVVLERMIFLGVIDAIFTLIYSLILVKKKIYKTKRDIVLSLIVFIIPLFFCYLLINIQISIVW